MKHMVLGFARPMHCTTQHVPISIHLKCTYTICSLLRELIQFTLSLCIFQITTLGVHILIAKEFMDAQTNSARVFPVFVLSPLVAATHYWSHRAPFQLNLVKRIQLQLPLLLLLLLLHIAGPIFCAPLLFSF